MRRLGSGGFGRVWLAHDARLGHTVALKAAHVRDAETEERIRREAHALATVRHPHCVQIHDLVPADSDPGLAELDGMVIVMEYVRGESLGELVRTRGILDDVAAARVWSSIAGALDAAHGRGVLHRDVKPGNIVVDADGQAHLIDFGIARKTGDATLTATGFVLGTPDFLPPEVAAGGRATPQSDSWQLAATVGYALCGQPPRGDHADAVSGLRAAALGGPADAPAAPVGAPGAAAGRAGRRPGPAAAAARGAPGAGRLVAVGRSPPRRSGDGRSGGPVTAPREPAGLRADPGARPSPARSRGARRRRSCRDGHPGRCARYRPAPPRAVPALRGGVADPASPCRWHAAARATARRTSAGSGHRRAARRGRRRAGRRAGRDGVGAHPARC